jgi:hypothetical protein
MAASSGTIKNMFGSECAALTNSAPSSTTSAWAAADGHIQLGRRRSAPRPGKGVPVVWYWSLGPATGGSRRCAASPRTPFRSLFSITFRTGAGTAHEALQRRRARHAFAPHSGRLYHPCMTDLEALEERAPDRLAHDLGASSATSTRGAEARLKDARSRCRPARVGARTISGRDQRCPDIRSAVTPLATSGSTP